MQPFFIALQFLTRLPVNLSSRPNETSTAYSLLYYPLVGLIIGALLTGLAWLLRDTTALLSAALLIVSWVLITGGLHLDGLADSADAWAGGLGSKEKTLAIMKDPNCGPAGVVSIVLLLLLKFAALHAIIETENITMLVLAPLLGRAILLLLFLTTPYVRSNGLGTSIANHLPRSLIFIVFVITIFSVFFLVGLKSLWFISIMLLAFVLLRFFMMRKIGGMTGDLAGALVEITETCVLVSIVLF